MSEQSFADTLKEVQKPKADDSFASALAEVSPKAATPDVRSSSWADRAVNWLPTIGGGLGAVMSSETGPGAILGAGAGGMLGEALKQKINVMRGKAQAPPTVMEALEGPAIEAVKQGALQGAGQAISATAALAPGLMRSALGNTALTVAKKPDVAEVALKAGATVTRSGIHQLDEAIAKTTGLADKAALQKTRDAVAQAWTDMSNDKKITLFGATAGNPAFRSAMAQGLYNYAAKIGRYTPQAVRAIMLGSWLLSDEP